MEEMRVLIICKLNIWQVLTFMFKIKQNIAPVAFRNDFRETSHQYHTEFSQSKFVEDYTWPNERKLLFCIEVQGSGIGY